MTGEDRGFFGFGRVYPWHMTRQTPYMSKAGRNVADAPGSRLKGQNIHVSIEPGSQKPRRREDIVPRRHESRAVVVQAWA